MVWETSSILLVNNMAVNEMALNQTVLDKKNQTDVFTVG